MKLRNSIFYFFNSILFISAISCGQTSSHEDDLNYYTTIALQMQDIVPKVQTFWGQIKQGVITAKQNQNQKLDQANLDSLKNSLNYIIADLDSKIKIIISLNETDNDLGFKKTILSYLTETKLLQETAIPKILELLEYGLDKVTYDQKKALETFSSKGQELQTKSAQIGNLSLQYQKKHEITNEELMKYGL